MKILFICSSLQEGSDGVGDYTRRLSSELIRAGHEATIIAINDGFLQPDEQERIQHDQGYPVSVLRLSARVDWMKRISVASDFVRNAAPDLISLQYVPYAFNDRGLPFGLGKSLKKVTADIPTHIMFHEMWVGITRLSPLKHKVYGFFQIRIARSLVKELNPSVITTSNRLYQLVLKSRDITADILPLFSNISLSEKNLVVENEMYKKLEISTDERDEYIIIGLFGSLYSGCKLENTIEEQYLSALAAGKKLAFVAFGRIGDIERFEKLKVHFAWQVKFAYLGELPEDEISTVMQVIDKATSCTPSEHYGKSGVYAAMKLHDLEVLNSVTNRVPEYEKEITEYNHFLANRDAAEWNPEFVAAQFLELLAAKVNVGFGVRI
jgi:hypothetical protein